MSNLPWIMTNGAEAFAALGEGSSTGTRLFALSGRVVQPGLVRDRDVEDDLPRPHLRPLARRAASPAASELRAFIPGGVSAPWFGPDQLDLGLDQDAVGKAGSMLGSGSVVVMDSDTCPVRAAWRIAQFFHRESCGQCTPCREGSGWIEKIMHRLEQGLGREKDIDLVLDACDNISPGLAWPPKQTTICVLGPSIPSAIVSVAKMFRDDMLVHVKEGGCPFPADGGRRG